MILLNEILLHLKHFLAHFGLYNYIGERSADPHTPSRVYGHNFRTGVPILKILGILKMADQGLSDEKNIKTI